MAAFEGAIVSAVRAHQAVVIAGDTGALCLGELTGRAMPRCRVLLHVLLRQRVRDRASLCAGCGKSTQVPQFLINAGFK